MQRTRRLAALTLAPLLVLVSIWLPVWQHYRVPEANLDRATIDSLRANPPDARLLELQRQAQDLGTGFSDSGALRQAEAIRQGRIELPSGEVRAATLPFDARDYTGGTPAGALSMASLVVPDLLLRAYETTGNETYFQQARQAILGFAEFERGLPTDLAMVRNDHAIAARVGVLIRFWRLYRNRADFDEAVARATLQHVARCAAYLGKASHFTVATNHGVMQNIALLQVTSAFPDLPGVPVWRHTADSRLRRQLAFYVNEEGVVLEHGPGYHRFGSLLIGMVPPLLQWNGLPPIDGLAYKHARSVNFLEQLQRPDGSIPRIGDTNGQIVPVTGHRFPGAGDVADGSFTLSDSTRIYPAAGYAITRRSLAQQPETDLGESHVTVYWSHYPGHGHEVAAEGSFLLWAAGTDWVGNTGFWPYGLPGRIEAEGWRGSNAPHIRGEAASSKRSTVLLAHAADGRSHLLDLARTIEGGPRLRRQVVQIDERTWFVLDSLATPLAEPVDRLWTLAPHLEIEAADAGLVAKDPSTRWRLRVNFLADRPLVVRTIRGSLEPFGGWVMNGPRPLPAASFEVTQPPGSLWVATVFSLVPPESGSASSAPAMQYSAEDNWSLSAGAGGSDAIAVQRGGDRLSVGGATQRHIRWVTPANNALQQRAAIEQTFAHTMRDFPRFKPHMRYRQRLSYVVGAAALVWLGAWLWTRRRAGQLPGLVIKLSLIFWVAAAAWIHLAYLAV